MPHRISDESRWSLAIADATFGVWDLDPRLDTVHYSPQWKARLGFPRPDASDSSAFWRCRVHPADVEPMLGSLRSHLDGASAGYEMRFRLRSNGSGYRTMQSRGRVVARDEAGIPTRMIGTMVDLTGRPAVAKNAALPADEPGSIVEAQRLPFHAAARRGHGLVDLIDDLLDISWREARAAR